MRNINPQRKQVAPARKKKARRGPIKTNAGWLVRIGTNPWGKALVPCPRCGEPATAGKTGDVWCRACGFDTATLVGCG